MSPDLIEELARAVALVEQHKRASVTLRVFSDQFGRARIRVERLDGVSLTELLDARVTMSKT